MESLEALELVLRMYGEYYTVKREGAFPPFLAEAECSVSDDLMTAFKSVKISSAVSREIVFFAAEKELTGERALALAEAAWNEGLSRVTPGPEHRNTDIILVILTDALSPEAAKEVKKLRRTKNYKFTFYGWSILRAVAIETPSGTIACNRMGQNLKKLFSNINF